jgi:hypothetical protein
MKIDTANLPNSVESLQALIVAQLKEIQSKDQKIDLLELRVHQLDSTLKMYLTRQFGRSADVAPQTNSLFNEAEQIVAESPLPDDAGENKIRGGAYTRQRGWRWTLPAGLER